MNAYLNSKQYKNVFPLICTLIKWKLSTFVLPTYCRGNQPKFVFLSSPGVDTKESILSAYVVWQAGTSNGVFVPVSIPGLLKRLQIVDPVHKLQYSM
jgi:hypothetical protein